MKKSVDYRGFTVMAKPILLESGEWNTVVQVKRNGAVKPFYAKDTWKSEEEAVRQSLWLGMRIIDGEVPEFNAGDLP
jgi:hypothetical protein